ncbi:hypothetical protein [Brachybacterium sp. UNK5269]|uniref:hypothetical protein n=1 Tax=Brachybacterium sp. UNK5269 TaxID=3408576 RepID=UPI003BB1C2F8
MTSTPGNSSAVSPEDAARRDRQQKLQRFFVTFAVIEGVLLAAAVVLIYVLEVIDPAIGHWVLIAIALLGGLVLSSYLMKNVQGNRPEQAERSALR